MKVRGRKGRWDLDRPFDNGITAISDTSANALGQVEPASTPEQEYARNTFQLYLRFLWAGITRHSQTGAVVPSQRFLIHKMISPVPREYRGEVVELGAGTGVLTLGLAARCPRARLLVCEINPELAADLESRVAAAGLGGRVRVSSEPAEHLLAHLGQWDCKPPEYVFSGIPLGNLVKDRAIALIRAIHKALRPGGLYIQFQHSLMDRRKIRQQFSELRTGFVLANVPPAFVYYARK